MTRTIPTALTIGGSDSSGATGIQADSKTFTALGVHALSVLTAVVAQNTREVAAIAEVPEEVVIAQLDTVLEDIGADAIKTGMLSARTIVECVVDRLEAWGAPKLVVDPVLVSPAGVPLLKPDALGTLRRELLPMALVVTSSVTEAEALSGRRIASLADAQDAAREIHARGPRVVIIKGGPGTDLPGDLILDDGNIGELGDQPIGAIAMQGASDVFAAAIAALLARGAAPLEAVERARSFVQQASRAGLALGDGQPMLHPLHSPENGDAFGRALPH